jgi:hypothetical protein
VSRSREEDDVFPPRSGGGSCGGLVKLERVAFGELLGLVGDGGGEGSCGRLRSSDGEGAAEASVELYLCLKF